MTLLETECEVEVRAYTEIGTLLNTSWLKKDYEQMKSLFPDIDFTDEDKESTWVETKEQADYLEVEFEDLGYIGYEIFLHF